MSPLFSAVVRCELLDTLDRARSHLGAAKGAGPLTRVESELLLALGAIVDAVELACGLVPKEKPRSRRRAVG